MPSTPDDTTPAAPAPAGKPGALVTSGKCLRDAATGEKTTLRGISYGPFPPNAEGAPFPKPDRLAADLTRIRELGFDTVRLYDLPTTALLQAASDTGLRLILGIPWTDHVDFLRNRARRAAIITAVRDAVNRLHSHPAVAAFLIGNEIEKTLVRWMGPRRVQRFLERLITEARAIAPNQLFSYATYPSTEYLIPRNADFLAMNVYLEQRADFAAYLQRLHHLAGNKPLLITEFGLDTARHGEAQQAETLAWFHEECARAAIAGTVWFSYTDEWHRSGQPVTGWHFGLTTADRQEKQAAATARSQFPVLRSQLPSPAATASPPSAPAPNSQFSVFSSQFSVSAATDSSPASQLETLNFKPETTVPQISVIVCTYNGAALLHACLASLSRLRHPSYEVLVMDDGSTQDIAAIVKEFPSVRYHRQDHAGLSAARNLGMKEARGSILAYTDDDCIADEHWLDHIAAGFDDPRWVACGGPNIPPPPRNSTEAIVAAAPGAPAHVMLSDAEAEHLPGCNLAIRRSALEAIGGFRAHYLTAGDDVDICWRLREHGHLRFMPGATVWHHRRRTLGAYLRQQRGYGHAEALLMRDHPDRFGPTGGARWRGAIYGDSTPADDLSEGSIFHGPLGTGLFQGIYQHTRPCALSSFSSILWLLLALPPLLLGWWPLSLGIIGLSIAAALCQRAILPQPPHPLTWTGELKLLLLCWLQPLVREAARLRGMITLRAWPSLHPVLKEVFQPTLTGKVSLPLAEWTFWSDTGAGREALLATAKPLLQQSPCPDGWQRLDLQGRDNPWFTTGLLTVTEYHGGEKRLTRARYLARVHGMLYLLLLVVAVFIYTRVFVADRDRYLGLMIAVFVPLLILFFNFLRVHRALKAAARQCGMHSCRPDKG